MITPASHTFLTAKQVATRYDLGVATIWRWARDREDFPKPMKLGANCTRWRLADIEAWEASRQEVAQ
jgi:prophage regulatory protein